MWFYSGCLAREDILKNVFCCSAKYIRLFGEVFCLFILSVAIGASGLETSAAPYVGHMGDNKETQTSHCLGVFQVPRSLGHLLSSFHLSVSLCLYHVMIRVF